MTSRLVPTSATMAIQRLAQSEDGQEQDQGLGQKSQGDVLADTGRVAAAVSDEPGKTVKVVGQEDDIGGFERGAAGDAAQCDADLGGGEGGGVVHAVADHAGRTVPGIELGDGRDLVGRQQAPRCSPTPSSRPIAAAVPALSPVSMTV